MSSPRVPLAVIPVAVGLLLGGAIAYYRHLGPAPVAPNGGTSATANEHGLIVSSERLNFGMMEIGEAVGRPLLLRNGSSEPIHVNIQTAGSGWTVEPAELTLPPGGVSRIQVIGKRTDDGLVSGEIRILSDRSPNEPLVVALEGGVASEGSASAEQAGAPSAGDPGSAVPGAADVRDGSAAASAGAPSGASSLPSRGGVADARVSVSSDRPEGSGVAGAASRGGDALNANAAGGGAPIVPFDPASARAPRRISDRPTTPGTDRPARNGETPVPLDPRADQGEAGSDPQADTPADGVSALVVSPSSTVRLLGTRNQFYAQQINVSGSSSGGSFTLGSPIQMPRIPLAFGQSMEFSQSGSAVGAYDAGSGQVTVQLPVSAVDSNGNAAPLVFSLTTGTIVTRNPNGVLVSVTGQARGADGQLRLVGIAKIPTGFRNGAEQQLVTIDVVGSLTFAPPASAQNASDAASGGAQENL